MVSWLNDADIHWFIVSCLNNADIHWFIVVSWFNYADNHWFIESCLYYAQCAVYWHLTWSFPHFVHLSDCSHIQLLYRLIQLILFSHQFTHSILNDKAKTGFWVFVVNIDWTLLPYRILITCPVFLQRQCLGLNDTSIQSRHIPCLNRLTHMAYTHTTHDNSFFLSFSLQLSFIIPVSCYFAFAHEDEQVSRRVPVSMVTYPWYSMYL